jgi:hypothetical protein
VLEAILPFNSIKLNNMNSSVKIFVFALLVSSLFFASCRHYLDVIPKGKVIATTTADYDQLMNDQSFYQYLYGGGWQVPTMMGDDVAAEDSYFLGAGYQTNRLFEWQAVIYNPDDQAQDLSTFLPNLYTCNKIINEVLTSTDGTDQKKQALRAEAMATRAWLYFQFINFYAKPYVASTAAQDPGFPIITTADITQKGFVRNPVQQVYDFIINDLISAIPDLPVDNGLKTRMNKAAAEGILGRVYLFMGRSSEALNMFNAAFTDNASASQPAQLYDYNVAFAPGGSFLPIDPYNGPNSPFTNYNDFTESIVAKTFGNNAAVGYTGMVLDPQTAALFDPSDLRLNFYQATFPNGNPNPGGRVRKYGAPYAKFGLEISELYLLRAESEARTNDLASAKADVERLRRSRMPAGNAPVPGSTASNQSALIRFIIDERTREFAIEGYRWFDMRRLSVDSLFSNKVYTHNEYLTAGGITQYLLNQPTRFVLQFPANILNANPGFTNNP